MGDAVCSRRERKRPTNATDEEREEEKKVSQKSGNLENEPTQVLLFAFFSSSFFCLVVSSRSEVLRFLFEEGTSFFVLLLFVHQTHSFARYKNTSRRFVAIP
mgnify:CR=1 FL=1